MHILMLTQLFQPEPNHLKGLSFARELQRRGHAVEVLTGFPNYPGGRLYPGYRIRWCVRETIDGVPVVRVPVYPSHNQSGLQRSLCYGSFALSAGLWGVRCVRRPDVVHVYQGPATLAWPAMVLRRRLGVPYVLDVQDLWPDSVTASGMFRLPGGGRLLNRWCRETYRKAARIVVLSEGYKSLLLERGVPPEKIDVVYNWCDEPSVSVPADAPGDAPFPTAGRFNVVFAGNMGTVQALPSVVAAARLVENTCPQVQFVFVGDGVQRQRLQESALAAGLRNVRFVPRQPARAMGRLFGLADALLIHLKDGPLTRVGIPQKTQAYMAAGRPIIVAVRGDTAELVRRARAGVACEPENPEALAHAVHTMAAMPPAERQALADNGRRFYRAELSFDVGVNRMVGVFDRALQGKA